MNAISRSQFAHGLANRAIDLRDSRLERAATDAGLDLEKVDRLDGQSDGRITGQQALDHLYDELDALDEKTAGLGAGKARTVYDAVKSASIAPIPISADQGRVIAAAARELLAEDRRDANGLSVWSKGGVASCDNPGLIRPDYAGSGQYKCNIFAGEAVSRAGLPFPINGQAHYVTAGSLPDQSSFLQRLASVDEVREGDLISIYRGTEPGHAEVVTGVQRGADGRVTGLKSIGAHENGVFEGTQTGASFLRAGDRHGGALVLPGETFRILRPMSPPLAPSSSLTEYSVPIKG